MKSLPLSMRHLGLLALFLAGVGAGWLGRGPGKAGMSGDAAAGAETRSGGPRGGAGTGAESRGAGGRTAGGGGGGGAESGKPLAPAGSQDFADAVRAVFQEPSESRRVAQFEKILARATPEHLKELVTLIRENDLRGNDTGAEWTRLWSRWGEADPAGAMDFIAGRDWQGWNPLAPSEARRKTMAQWALSDPQGAVRYFEASGDVERGDRNLVYPLVRGLADGDPEAAADWLFKSGLGMGDEYKAVIDGMRRQKGMEGADAWFDDAIARGVPTRDLAGLAGSLLASREQYEPEKAAAWLEQHLAEPWLEQSSLSYSVARAYAARDPEAAMDWVTRNELKRGAADAMLTWYQNDAKEATAWLDGNRSSPVYTEAASFGAMYLATRDYDSAVRIAQNIPEEQARNQVLGDIANVRAQHQRRIQEDAPR